MTAFTDKSKIIDTIGDHVGDESCPTLFASSSSRRQHLPTPPRQELRGSIGSSCFGCARNDLRSIDRSRRTVQTPHYEPNGSARAGEGRSVVRGRVLSQSLLVARERRRREPGYNPVIDTTALTSGEGHVVKDGTSRRVRKILAGVPASVSIRDHILALSSSRSKRQYWTVGNRPIRNNDLRSLHRNSVEAQIQDRSRQKTGLNTAPGFSRVYPSFPRTTPSFPRTTPSFPRTREPREKQSTPPNLPFVIPASHPSFPRTREPRRGNPEKNKAHRQTSPSRSEGDACKARRGCPKTTNTPPSKLRTPRQPLHHPPTPSIIPASHPSFPRAIRHSRGRGNPVKTKHTAKPPLRGAKGTRAQHAGDARKPPTPPLRSSEHQDNPSIIPPPPSVIPARLLRHSRKPLRHSREPSVIPASHPSFPRTREPREKQSTPPNLPFAQRRGRVRSTQGMPENHQHRPFEAPNTKTKPPSSPHPSVIPASHPSFPRTREPREKQSTPSNLPFAERRGRVRSTQGMPENHQHRPFEAPNTKTKHLIIRITQIT